MARTGYEQAASEAAERLVAELFAIGGIGYVALAAGQEVLLRKAPDLATDTTSESNFYEELILNPSVLNMVQQRADLDCDGLRYVAIGYGTFVQLIVRMRDGHVSLGLPRNAPVPAIAKSVHEILERHGRGWVAPAGWLLSNAHEHAAR